jgi:hypothetical protein
VHQRAPKLAALSGNQRSLRIVNCVTEDGRSRTREVKPAVFFTQDKLDDEGYPVRDPESSSYLAATFADLVEAEGIRRGAHHIRQLTSSATAPPGSAIPTSG